VKSVDVATCINRVFSLLACRKNARQEEEEEEEKKKLFFSSFFLSVEKYLIGCGLELIIFQDVNAQMSFSKNRGTE